MEEPAEAMAQGNTAVPQVMVETAAPDTAAQETPAHDTEVDAAAGPQEEVETPGWYAAGLVNAATGEQFSIRDFDGKVVLVETMAIWCTTCRAQQGEIAALHEKLGPRDDFVSLTLDIDPNENQSDLKSYIEQNGFDWWYAVAPAEVSREIGNLYGDQFLNPPSAPILLIDRQGAAHPLPFGVKSADDLFEAVNRLLDEM